MVIKDSFSIRHFFSWDSLLPPRSSYKRLNNLLYITWLLVVFTVLSGAIRKWVTGPGVIGNVIFLAQLIAPFVFYFLVIRTPYKGNFRAPFMMALYILYLVVAALNPKNLTFFHGIFGIIIHLGFWVGWLAYYQKRPVFEIEKFTNLFILILIGEAVLASIQYSLPGSHILNRLTTGGDTVALVGEAFRVSGTFSFLAGLQSLVTFYSFFIWFLMLRKAPPFLIFIIFLLSVFTGMMTGSRSGVAFLIIVTVFGMLSTGYWFKNSIKMAVQATLLIVLIGFMGSSLISQFENVYKNFKNRVDAGIKRKAIETRVGWMYDEVLDFKGKYPVYGIGLGSTYQGAIALFGKSTYAEEYGWFESEPGRIILEGGYILFLFRVLLFIVMLRYSFVPFLGKALFLILFLNNMITFNIYQGLFFLLGLILVDRAYYLNKREASHLQPTTKSAHV